MLDPNMTGNANEMSQQLFDQTRCRIRFTWNHQKDEVQADVHHIAHSVAFIDLLHKYNAALEKLIRGNSRVLSRVRDLTAWKVRFIWDAKTRTVIEEQNKILDTPALVRLNKKFAADLARLIHGNERMLT